MKDYDAYLFDWDGTLADSSYVWLQIVRAELAKRGLTPADPEIMAALGDWQHMLELGLPPEELVSFSATAHRHATEQLPDAPLFPNARDVPLRLKQQGKKIAVVTAMPRHIVDSMLRHHAMQDTFDAVISSSEVQAMKPDPEGIFLALSHLGVTPSQKVIMFGDTVRDLRAARNAGIQSALFSPSEHEQLHDTAVLQACLPTYTFTAWQTVLDQL
jgi:HAD superfamily hydrolase (TIGR01509 family)